MHQGGLSREWRGCIHGEDVAEYVKCHMLLHTGLNKKSHRQNADHSLEEEREERGG